MDLEMQAWGFISPETHRVALEEARRERDLAVKAALREGKRSAKLTWFYDMRNDAKVGAVMTALFALFVLTGLGVWVYNVVDEPPAIAIEDQIEFFKLDGRDCVRVPDLNDLAYGLDVVAFCETVQTEK